MVACANLVRFDRDPAAIGRRGVPRARRRDLPDGRKPDVEAHSDSVGVAPQDVHARLGRRMRGCHDVEPVCQNVRPHGGDDASIVFHPLLEWLFVIQRFFDDWR